MPGTPATGGLHSQLIQLKTEPLVFQKTSAVGLARQAMKSPATLLIAVAKRPRQLPPNGHDIPCEQGAIVVVGVVGRGDVLHLIR